MLKEVDLWFFCLNMSGSADSRKGNSVKKRLEWRDIKGIYIYSQSLKTAVRSESDCESRVAGSSPCPATYFCGDLSWTNFYGHSPPSAVSRRADVSFWLSTGESMCTKYWLNRLLRLNSPMNSVVRLTDCRYMTEILLLWRKPTQTNKQNFIFKGEEGWWEVPSDIVLHRLRQRRLSNLHINQRFWMINLSKFRKMKLEGMEVF